MLEESCASVSVILNLNPKQKVTVVRRRSSLDHAMARHAMPTASCGVGRAHGRRLGRASSQPASPGGIGTLGCLARR